MLQDLIINLINAKTPKEEEKAFKTLEKVGIDRYTAVVIAKKLATTVENK